MDSYPCPACGGRATEATGCQRCGRPHDPDAAAFALFRRTAAALDTKKKNLTADQKLLSSQIASVTAQRDSLRRKILSRLTEEDNGGGTDRVPLSQRFLRRARGNAFHHPAEDPADAPQSTPNGASPAASTTPPAPTDTTPPPAEQSAPRQ
ncbi:MAG: hypothetical protein HKP61_13670, partial [Dactylosporangium sp.]|nr:hypothetical protein [Dactylosporangium sp.]NNJ61962.1 hypothetical protein [Dactylosporangium sp.]